MTDRLLPYYNRELEFLRRFGAEFAAEHPKIAGRLRLGDDLSEDPHVSRMIEAFALLAARTRLKIDDEFPEITHALLGVLYPHYLAPFPSTAIVEFALDGRQAELVAGYPIEAGQELETETTDDGSCRFRTVYPVHLLPLRVAEASYKGQPVACPPTPLAGAAEAVLHLRLDSFRRSVPVASMDLRKLRFFVRGLSKAAMDLYESIHAGVIEVLLARSPQDPAPIRLGPSAIGPVGFDESESLLPAEPRTFSGYRLLTEYFAAPEKFLFFDVGPIDPARLSDFGDQIHVYLLTDRHQADVEPFVATDTIRIGCTPVINLFGHRAEPIRVSHETSEYRIVPDVRRPQGYEVHGVTRVTGLRGEGQETVFHPFYSVRHAAERERRRGFYHLRRRPAEAGGGGADRATEVFLSLVDLDFRPELPDGTVLDVMTLCTSRNLPSNLDYGRGQPRMQLVRGGPVDPPRCVTQPRKPIRPPLGRQLDWRLISHLALGHISLFDRQEGATALREILGVYEHLQAADVRQRIESVRSLKATPGVARCPAGPGGPTFCRGVDLQLTIDEERLSSGGAYLLGAVLERFLALYASINSFTRTTVRSTLRDQPISRWPARSGRKTLL